MAEFKEVVFSGVQPTGNLHLGHYLGAIQRFVELQAGRDSLSSQQTLAQQQIQFQRDQFEAQKKLLAQQLILAQQAATSNGG